MARPMSVTPSAWTSDHLKSANAVGFQISAAVLGASLLPAAVGIVADRLGLEIVGPSLLALALALIALYESLRFAGPKEMREATLPA